jgi:hypothetical protein
LSGTWAIGLIGDEKKGGDKAYKRETRNKEGIKGKEGERDF